MTASRFLTATSSADRELTSRATAHQARRAKSERTVTVSSADEAVRGRAGQQRGKLHRRGGGVQRAGARLGAAS